MQFHGRLLPVRIAFYFSSLHCTKPVDVTRPNGKFFVNAKKMGDGMLMQRLANNTVETSTFRCRIKSTGEILYKEMPCRTVIFPFDQVAAVCFAALK